MLKIINFTIPGKLRLHVFNENLGYYLQVILKLVYLALRTLFVYLDAISLPLNTTVGIVGALWG